jgi:UDP-N-acetylmuramoylalanine--D-glutamate ligase
MNALQHQHVLILGLGISGLSMARWCVRHGAQVTVADTRETPPSLAALRAECPTAAFVGGAFDDSLLARAAWSVIARSPGLPPEQLAPARSWAQAHGAVFVGELDLFAQALCDLAQREMRPYRPKVLAITGTNGKTTVTSLTGLLLQRAGLRVAVAGNIGPALLDVLSLALDSEREGEAQDAARAVADAPSAVTAVVNEVVADVAAPQEDGMSDEPLLLDAAETSEQEDGPTQLVPPTPPEPEPQHLPQAWVLELSSFQLDSTAGGPWDSVPTVATVLNLSEDHLDWHGSMAAYAQAKTAVFGARALMLLNRDDPMVAAMAPEQVTVKVGGRHRLQPSRPWTSFGCDVPARAGDWGIEAVNGMEWLVRALALDETRRRGRAQVVDEEIYLQRLMPVDALRIRGRHNAANALAALALATSTGAPLAPMLHGLREYRGEPHRVESVGILDDVEYVDDSKGTNVGATLAAVRGLGVDRRLVVILGGDGKGQDFSPLAQPLATHARALVLIGRDAPRIREQVADALRLADVPMTDAVSMSEAVTKASQLAKAGDVVLMSPACASMDMFRDYKHRAEVFVDAVRTLADARGVLLEGAL